MGRKKKAVTIEPPPQHKTPENQWDAQTGEFRWLPDVEAAKWEEANKIRAEKDAHAEVAAKSYQKKVKAERATDLDIDSLDTPKPEEAKKLLLQFGTTHKHISAFAHDVFPLVSDIAKIPVCNRYTYLHGPIKQAVELGLIDEDSPVNDDRIFSNTEAMERERLLVGSDLRCLWNYAALIGYYADKSPEQWLADRYRARHDLYFLGAEICGKTFDPVLHATLCDFFGHIDDSRFPRDYKQDDIRVLFREHFDGPKVRMLWAYRGAYKSTLNMLFISMLMTICPDIRVLVLSAFRDLGELFIKEFKQYWIVSDFSRGITRLQALFPEFCVRESDAGPAEIFNSPMMKSFAKEDFLRFGSSNSGLGGQHFDAIAGDDYVLPKCSTPKLRPGLKAKYLQAKELLDPHGKIWLIGTPYHGPSGPGGVIEGDLYHTLLSENEGSGGDMKFLRVPSWTVKPEFENVNIHDLTEEMVTLARQDGRLTFRDLKADLGTKLDTEINFRRQKLCEGVAEPSEESLHIFKEDMLDACLEHESQIPFWASTGNTNWSSLPLAQQSDAPANYAMWDLAFSANPTSDDSASADIIRAVDPETGLSHLFITSMWSDKLGTAELAIEVLRSFKRSLDEGRKFKTILIEKMNGWDLFQEKVHNEARIRGLPEPPSLYFVPIDRTDDAKNLRIRALQILIHSRRIHFMGGHGWWDKLKNEFLMFDGKKSSTKKQDNLIDVVALAARHLHVVGTDTPKEEPPKPLSHDEQKAEFIAQWDSEQKQRNLEFLRTMHQIRFPSYDSRPTTGTNEAPVNPYSPAGIMEQYRKRIGGR